MNNRIVTYFLTAAIASASPIICEEVKKEETAAVQPKKTFEPFTGKVGRNKVRLRAQPTTDSAVIRELNRNDLIIILGETEDFYTVQPFKESKGYVYRTYVLDNIVEGNRVNVRLKPDLESPVIAQLNAGDRIEGKVDAANPKWLEITAPESTRFYVAKEFIEKAGDVNLLTKLEKRRTDAEKAVNNAYALSEAEMQKPFDQTNYESVVSAYKKAAQDFADIPDAANRASALLNAFQEAYTNKKIAFLESQTQYASKDLESKTKSLQDKIVTLEQQLKSKPEAAAIPQTQIPVAMAAWIPSEQALFSAWSIKTNNDDIDAFYQEQLENAFTLKGVIEPYSRPVKNKPGDFMLVNSTSKLPVAFLHSTKVNLQNYIGHEVAIVVAPRSNNNYAFPAYFVLTLE